MSKASCSTLGDIKSIYLCPLGTLVTSYHHLRDAFTIGYFKRGIGKIYKDYTYLTTIISIYCTGSCSKDLGPLTQSRTRILEGSFCCGTSRLGG